MSEIDLSSLHLEYGSHTSREAGMCLMEAVAYVAGEPHSDEPACACPVIAAFGRVWNDALDDEARQRLLAPYVPRLVGTRSTPEIEERRAYMALDWLIRTHTPAWLDLQPALAEHAAALRALPEIVDLATAGLAGVAVTAAESAAWSNFVSATDQSDAAFVARFAAESDVSQYAAEYAARSVAEYAAQYAARSAARSAAESAARSAAEFAAESAALAAALIGAESAARSAALTAALIAAEFAARSAAWAAAVVDPEIGVERAARSAVESAAEFAALNAALIGGWSPDVSSAALTAALTAARSAESALRPTVERLQVSAGELLDRMIAAQQEVSRV